MAAVGKRFDTLTGRPPDGNEAVVACVNPPLRQECFAGLNASFRIADQWSGDTSISIQPPRREFLVQPERLGPEEHLRQARGLAPEGHSLAQLPAVAHGVAAALSTIKQLGRQVSVLRLKRLALLAKWKKELELAQLRMPNSVDPGLIKCARKPTLLTKRVLELIGSPDAIVADELALGLPDLGYTPYRATFPRCRKFQEPRVSISELLERAPSRNRILVRQLEAHHPRASELGSAGVKAEALGSMGPVKELSEYQAEGVIFVKKIPVVQGDEVRACADASGGRGGAGYNAAFASRTRVACSDSEAVLAHVSASTLAFGEPAHGCKHDLQKAYWQIPRRRRYRLRGVPTLVRVVLLFWSEEAGCVVGRELFSLDFGMAGAVESANRVFRSICLVEQYFLAIPSDHY